MRCASLEWWPGRGAGRALFAHAQKADRHVSACATHILNSVAILVSTHANAHAHTRHCIMDWSCLANSSGASHGQAVPETEAGVGVLWRAPTGLWGKSLGGEREATRDVHGAPAPHEESVGLLVGMGFSRSQVRAHVCGGEGVGVVRYHRHVAHSANFAPAQPPTPILATLGTKRHWTRLGRATLRWPPPSSRCWLVELCRVYENRALHGRCNMWWR